MIIINTATKVLLMVVNNVSLDQDFRTMAFRALVECHGNDNLYVIIQDIHGECSNND